MTTSEGTRIIAEGGVLTGPAWLHHDGIGYLLPEECNMHFEAREKTGSWESINRSRPGSTITEPVFNCWIDHGEKPTDVGYVYHILPDVDTTEMAALSKRRDIEVLSNSSELQAVLHKTLGITAVAFYSPGKLERADGADITVDSSCILLVREMPGKRLRIAFSKPDSIDLISEKVTVSVGGRKVVFSPSAGPEKGRPVVRDVRLGLGRVGDSVGASAVKTK